MIRTWLALAAFSTATAWAAGPSYSAANFVNASNYTAGPFAPNSVVSIFGTGLARSEHRLTEADLVACTASQLPARCLPLEMNFVRVYVRDQAVPILFVSQNQINFLISSEAIAGPATVRVVSEGITGPEVTLPLADSAPALFSTEGGYALATDANGVLLTPEAPAREGDIVVVYVTGLGWTVPNPVPGEIPGYAAPMRALSSLRVALNGKPLDPTLIKYAGVTPRSAGLYQLNLYLPQGTGTDPEIEVTAGNLAAPTALKLPVRSGSAQPSASQSR